MMELLLRGFFSPVQGLRIILSSPKNVIFSLIPFSIGFLVIGAGYMLAAQYLNPWVESFTSGIHFLETWTFLKPIVDFLILIFTWILISFVNFFVGYLTIIVFAGPFYALMVENIFKVELPDKEPRSSLKLIVSMFVVGLAKVFLFLTIGLICFIMSFIPGLNLLAPLIIVLTVAFDCMDYAFEVDFLNLRQRFDFFAQNIMIFVGIGLAVMATNLIPGLFFILLPAFICGATKTYIQHQDETV
jgi:CysZ protein